MYANDICNHFKLDAATTTAVLRYALWHDVDEVFTGDLPGPNKRHLLVGHADNWKSRTAEWMREIFAYSGDRGAEVRRANHDIPLVKEIVKCADWLEAAMFMATEIRMGNADAEVHFRYNTNMAVETAESIEKMLGYLPGALASDVFDAVTDCRQRQPRGPVVTIEMTSGAD
jgi:5'-deoxynucleotidase YfbR-like HD superfamily hydrolase